MQTPQYSGPLLGLIMSIVLVLEYHFGWTLGISEEFVIGLLVILTPIAIWIGERWFRT
jgi:hypothetical protein